ncbi:MAG: hypothetical protein K9N48_01335 [Verrucomicrobia bacterium]|nr:hypothetical protein [Verrucomicrobiota bacterium]MCF7707295.1 hypothetical protein [Verrucomicrobiota bacterium]
MNTTNGAIIKVDITSWPQKPTEVDCDFLPDGSRDRIDKIDMTETKLRHRNWWSVEGIQIH